MHRTTVELDDKLLRHLKEICAKERKTFKQLVLDLVRAGLGVRYGPRKKALESSPPLRHWVTSKVELPKGIDPADRSTYWHFLQRPLP